MEAPVTGYLEGASIELAAAVLRSGGIAVLPTDTIYGFHCRADRADAIREILNRKGRVSKAGLILLATDIAMCDCVVGAWPVDSRRALARIWPAPLTAILPASAAVSHVLAPGGAVAVRIPAHEALRAVIRAVGLPLVSTSVNLSGRPPMTRTGEIQAAFPGLGAYLARRGRPGSLPSTVVDFTVVPPSLVRRGRYRWPGNAR